MMFQKFNKIKNNLIYPKLPMCYNISQLLTPMPKDMLKFKDLNVSMMSYFISHQE